MIQKVASLLSIPIVFFYMSFVTKKKEYAYGGLFGVVAMLLALTYTKSDFIDSLVNSSLPMVPGSFLRWSLYTVFAISFMIFLIKTCRAETGGAYQTTTRDDLIKIIRPNFGNIFFWMLILLLNILVKSIWSK